MKALHLLTVSAGMVVSMSGIAQIPNGHFEDWSPVLFYQDPDEWTSLNASVSRTGMISCEPVTPGASDYFGAKLTTVNVPGTGTIPGTLISGRSNTFQGFPFTDRPAAMSGAWKYAPVGSDLGIIAVTLTRWDPASLHRVIIGLASFSVSSATSSWTALNLPITYASALSPDTATISMVSGSIAGTSLWVDDLAFGPLTSVEEFSAIPISIFPVPARDHITVEAGSVIHSVDLIAADGRVVDQRRVSGERVMLDVSELPAGLYVAQLRFADGTVRRRSVIREN